MAVVDEAARGAKMSHKSAAFVFQVGALVNRVTPRPTPKSGHRRKSDPRLRRGWLHPAPDKQTLVLASRCAQRDHGNAQQVCLENCVQQPLRS